MATENVKERSQAGAEPTLLATLVGKVRQIIVNTTTFRPHIMDGTTAGGHPLAFQKELLSEGPTLTETAQNKALTALGVYSALETLITEYGGTVPTETSEQTTEDQA